MNLDLCSTVDINPLTINQRIQQGRKGNYPVIDFTSMVGRHDWPPVGGAELPRVKGKLKARQRKSIGQSEHIEKRHTVSGLKQYPSKHPAATIGATLSTGSFEGTPLRAALRKA
ncbi:hypothetical protein J6590_061210 [Homalodisca vitripennis]|nr:hypothetical protein J6590_061210 [Homalodisca vitripennis]